ncbi:zinc-ribbon and DUF3426 domain-containing protein [Paraburkholderia saeva]|nr:zinc-ribbon and DUF3426 domain-containing protein [Paraburkholderia saeva]CAG4916138.1 hypothetical protein R52603_04418 [Paraburkholderia saeva]
MLLATRCPFCETVFRLQPTHLSLRRGLVRCGHCHEVFDASSSLYETTDGDLSTATPVSPDVVAALIAGTEPKRGTVSAPEPVHEPETQHDTAEEGPLAGSRVEPTFGAIEPEVEAPSSHAPLETPEQVPSVSTSAAADEVDKADEPDAFSHTETRAETAMHSSSAEPRAPLETPAAADPDTPFDTPAPVEPHTSARTFEDTHQHAAGAPDFRSDAWNPWAPAPDALIDERLRHSTKNLPYRPLSESAMAKLKVAIEREAAERAAREGTAAAPAHDFPTMHGPVHEPVHAPINGHHAVDDDSDATRWRPIEPDTDEPAFANAPAGAAIYPETHDSEPRFTSAAAAPFATSLDHDEDEAPFAVVRETREAEPRRTGWIILGSLVALVLFVGLIAQLAWWQRETVMVYWPGTQPLYAQACVQFGCTVAPPRDIDGLQVEPSDLRQVDGPHKLELKMPLRNRFGVALAYPAIELTLLDAQNNIAIRRVLWPQDYVTPGTSVAAGLPGHSTQTMIVRLDTGDAVASNFRVQIFYP